MRYFLAIVFLSVSSFGFGQVAIPLLPEPITTFANEAKDWGVVPVTTPTSFPGQYPFHSPTPTTIPGARVIKTLELKALLETNDKVVIVDVLDTSARTTVPGATWLYGAGDSRFFGGEKARFATVLETLTGGDKNRPLVFLCMNSECWLSYNASLHALEAGYRDVIWYRGGTNAWSGASLERKKVERFNW